MTPHTPPGRLHPAPILPGPPAKARLRRGHWGPMLLFAAVPAALFLPITLTGNLVFGSSDLYFHLLNRLYPVRWVLRHGIVPLWNPYVNSGMPFVGDLQGVLFSPYALLFYLLPMHWAQFFSYAFSLFLAGAFFFLFLRELGLRELPALFGGLAFELNSVVVSQVFNGNIHHLNAYGFIPVVFFLAERGLRRRHPGYFITAGAVLALMLFAGHGQYVLYTATALAPYLAWRTWQFHGSWRQTLAFYALMGIVAVGLAAPQLLPSLEFRQASNRAGGLPYGIVARDSLPPQNLLTLVMPYCFGCPGNDTMWQTADYSISNLYFGIAPLLLAGFIVLAAWNRTGLIRLFAAFWAFSLVMTLGRHAYLYHLFYALVPGYSTFRGPGRFQVYVGFSQAALAGIGLEHLLASRTRLDSPRTQRILRLFFALALAMLGGFLLLWLFRHAVFHRLEPYGRRLLYDLYYNHGRGRAHPFSYHLKRMPLAVNIFIGQGLRAAAFTVAALAILAPAFRGRLPKQPAALLLIALLTADLFSMARPMIKPVAPSLYFGSHPALDFLKKHPPSGRVLWHDGVLRDQGGMWSGIRDTRGYNPVVIRRYLELLAANDGRKPETDLFYTYLNDPDGPLVRLLNIEYYLKAAGGAAPDPRRWKRIARFPGLRFRHVEYKDFQMIFPAEIEVYRAVNPLPRAWFVRRVDPAPPDASTLRRMCRPDFDPGVAAEAVCPAATARHYTPEHPLPATVTLKKAGPNRLVFETRTAQPRFLVLSEIYYPGWKARIDGRRVPIFRTDHALRGVGVPAGIHRLTVVYQPDSLRLGLALAGITLVCLLSAPFLPWRRLMPVLFPPRAEHRAPAAGLPPQGAR